MTSATINLSPKTIITNGQTDTWLKASWLEFMELTEAPNLSQAKFYFDRNFMRVEITPIGSSHYIGSNLKFPPRNDSAVDLEQFDLPTLVIEIAATSIQDDLGYKRLLYEKIGIPEYWVVNARTSEIFAFAIADGRSGRITHSQVLAGLDLAIIETALQRSRLEDDTAIFRWLLEVFSNPI